MKDSAPARRPSKDDSKHRGTIIIDNRRRNREPSSKSRLAIGAHRMFAQERAAAAWPPLRGAAPSATGLAVDLGKWKVIIMNGRDHFLERAEQVERMAREMHNEHHTRLLEQIARDLRAMADKFAAEAQSTSF